jgi:MarR family transcriptional regulator, organic hydroperoxide resistance regulator
MTFSLNQSLGFVTNRAANRLRAELERGFATRGHNITAEQWSVLSRLYEEDGLAQYEIAERISRDKTNVARILALMERRGLIERRIDSDDHRARKIYVTDYGHSLESDLVASAKEVLARAQQGFSDEDIQQLIQSLNRIFDNLD